MCDTKQYKNYNLKIIHNKKLKHSYISLDKEGSVVVKTAKKSFSFVESLLEEKDAWIQKHLQKQKKMTKIQTQDSCYSLEYLEERLDYFSKKMNLFYTKLRLKKLKSIWGSCNSKCEITLNTQLQYVDKNLIDYVVVHELAHIEHMNHSKDFHALVEKFLPNSKIYRKELKNIRLS